MKRILTLIAAFFFFFPIAKAEGHIGAMDGQHSRKSRIIVQGNHDTASACAASKPAAYSIYRNNIYKKLLDSIQKDVQLVYNDLVQALIETYLSAGRDDISREIGLSKYYFPIYEKAFRDAGIPEEIKYLSL